MSDTDNSLNIYHNMKPGELKKMVDEFSYRASDFINLTPKTKHTMKDEQQQPTLSTYEQEAEKMYPGKTKKAGPHGVMVLKQRTAHITACNMRREELEAKDREIDYWRQRCKLAEDCSEKRPCDPDITEEQIEAWSKYYSFIKEHGGKPY